MLFCTLKEKKISAFVFFKFRHRKLNVVKFWNSFPDRVKHTFRPSLNSKHLIIRNKETYQTFLKLLFFFFKSLQSDAVITNYEYAVIIKYLKCYAQSYCKAAQVTKVRNYLQVLQFWWLALKNFREISREQVLVNDSSEILEKFPGISPQFERFFRNYSFETYLVSRNFWEFFQDFSQEITENFSGIFLRKFLNINPQ